jgi:hypothetical protein
VYFPEELAVFDRLRTIRDFLSPESLLSSKKDVEAKGKYAKWEDPRYDGANDIERQGCINLLLQARADIVNICCKNLVNICYKIKNVENNLIQVKSIVTKLSTTTELFFSNNFF